MQIFWLLESEEKEELSPKSEEKNEEPKSLKSAEERPTPKIPESKGKIFIYIETNEIINIKLHNKI